MREPGTVLNAPAVSFSAIALVSRAATYKVWERAQGKDEHLFWLIAPALVGAALGGVVPQPRHAQPLADALSCHVGRDATCSHRRSDRILLHEYRNGLLGAFYTRVVELWQVPMLWAIHLLTDHAHIDLLQGALGMLVACASAYTYLQHSEDNLPRRTLSATEISAIAARLS